MLVSKSLKQTHWSVTLLSNQSEKTNCFSAWLESFGVCCDFIITNVWRKKIRVFPKFPKVVYFSFKLAKIVFSLSLVWSPATREKVSLFFPHQLVHQLEPVLMFNSHTHIQKHLCLHTCNTLKYRATQTQTVPLWRVIVGTRSSNVADDSCYERWVVPSAVCWSVVLALCKHCTLPQ